MIEFHERIERIGLFDVVVVGGGVAGVGAAIEAARQGASVAIVERSGAVGGMLTAGHVSPPLGNYVKNTLADELFTAAGYIYNSGRSHDIEQMKGLITEMVEKSGAALFLGCAAAGVNREHGRIADVIFSTQSGLKAVGGKVFVDATGDGVLSFLAGEETEYGRSDGLVQPMSIMFTAENIRPSQKIICNHEEMDTPLKEGNYLALCREASRNGELPPNVNIVRLYRGANETERLVNATQANGFDPLSPTDLGKAQFELRRQIGQVMNFLKRHVEGFENARVKESADGVGVRESRRVVCEHMLTAEELLRGARFGDVIVHRAAFCLDIHNPSGAGQSEQDGRPKDSGQYDIPYRSVLPKKTENLLVAGRCIGGTHRAHASYRVMNICMNVGQAVGAAAALSVREGVSPRELDVKRLQAALAEHGIDLFG